MSSSGVDIGSLTPSQAAALEQYTAVTNQETDAAILLLQRTQWNIQIAIARFFDGEPVPIEEAYVPAPPRDTRVQEVLANGFGAESSRSVRLKPAPRIVPSPNPNVAVGWGFPFNLILAPFNLVSYILTRGLRILGSIFPFLPVLLGRLGSQNATRQSNRRALKPRDTAARFIREFEETYGPNEAPFRELGYAHSLDEAKRDLKYLLVVIISPEHDDTPAWVRGTLLAPEVVSFLRNKESNIILWGGSVQDSEAYQVATAFNVTKFPYAALIAHTPAGGSRGSSSNAMSIIAPLSGVLPPAEFLSHIRRAIDAHAPEINRLRSEQAERQASRSLREQQDSAYERSLALDRERARQRRQEEEERKKAEEEKQQAEAEKEKAVQNLQDWKLWRSSRVLPEPSAEDKESVRVSVRLPDGERAMRRFDGSANLEEIYAFVECIDLLKDGQQSKEAEKPKDYVHQYGFRLVSPMPRTVFDVESQVSIKQLIGRSANLIVEPIDEDEDD